VTSRGRARDRGSQPVSQLAAVAGPALLRVSLFSTSQRPSWWPDLDDPTSCRTWLREVWTIDGFSEALHTASPALTQAVERVLSIQADGQATGHSTGQLVSHVVDELPDRHAASAKQVRKATVSVLRYLLRATDRSTPFSLFAGTALTSTSQARVGGTTISVGNDHRPYLSADTAWVAAVRKDFEQRGDVLRVVELRANGLLTRHGALAGLPAPDGRTLWVRITGPLQELLDHASTPTTYGALAAALRAAGGTEAQVDQLVASAVRQTLLVTTLRAPMTITDPLVHLLQALEPHLDALDTQTIDDLKVLAGVAGLTAEHNMPMPSTPRQALRSHAHMQMSRFDTSTRARLAIHTRADAQARLPEGLASEVARAAHALMRLTRNPAGDPVWAHYQTMFWERYGPDVLVPILDATDPGAGIGFPADYPLTTWQVRDSVVLDRDKRFAALAWKGLNSGNGEVVLSEGDIDELAGIPAQEQTPPPHVDLAVQVAARDTAAVDAGDYTVHVHPAWAAGVMTGRFAAVTDQDTLAATYRSLPTLVDQAIPAQLVFTPVYPHAENVSRIPRILPTQLAVDPADAVDLCDPAATAADTPTTEVDTILVDDLALYSSREGLRLVSISRRRVVEPLTLHPLALDKQAPPIARFLAHVARSSATAWTEFDWGPALAEVPRLPRVRYGRTILSPARWRLRDGDLPSGSFNEWHAALTAWATTWQCPMQIGLQHDDRTLRLDLTEPAHAQLLRAHLRQNRAAGLVETTTDDDLGWIGHAHEIVFPIASAVPPTPHPDLTHAPVFRRRRPAPAIGKGLQQVRTHRPTGDPRSDQRDDRSGPARARNAHSDGAPGPAWTQARVFTHPQLMDHLLTRQVPRLIDRLEARTDTSTPTGADPDGGYDDGASGGRGGGSGAGSAGRARWWFIRYRSIEDEDHLRIRVAVPDRRAPVEAALAAWFDEVHHERLAHRILFDSYRPETGRYGEGTALAAAEAVFEADSNLVLQILASAQLETRRACALSMLDLACGFLGPDRAVPVLAGQTWDSPVDRTGDRTRDRELVADVSAGAVRLPEALAAGSTEVALALERRAVALLRYRDALQPGQGGADVLESLLHMHHNRFLGPDRPGEAECRHAVAQAARSMIARSLVPETVILPPAPTPALAWPRVAGGAVR
jgi:thiopeptide-type bacteriocin biosynthesis protein